MFQILRRQGFTSCSSPCLTLQFDKVTLTGIANEQHNFLFKHPCMRHPGRSYSTELTGICKNPNACTVRYATTNSFWTRMSLVHGHWRDAAGFNFCTAVLNSFGTDGTYGVRPNLASRCLCRAVLMNYLLLFL